MSPELEPKPAGERRRDKRLAEIAEAARTLFGTRGYSETSLAEIADAVDLSPKAIYYYYESKRAILDSILERGFVYFEPARLAKARAQWDEMSLRDALVESGVVAVGEILGHADLLRLSFTETFRGNAMTRARHEVYMANWTEHVRILLGREPSFAPEVRQRVAQALVEALLGVSVDYVLRGRGYSTLSSDDAGELRGYVGTLVEALLNGVQSSFRENRP